MQQSGPQQVLHDERHAAHPVQVGHHVSAAGTHVSDVGHALADAVDIVQIERNVRFPRDGGQMERRIGRATGSERDGNGIL